MHYKNRLGFYIFLPLMLLFIAIKAEAQAKYVGEIGVLGGASYYNGDANSSKIFLENCLAFGGLVRLNVNSRFKIKMNLIRGEVSGDTRNFDNSFPNEQQASFERAYWDLGFHLEHYFYKYGMAKWDREVKRHTPYILIGPGLTMYEELRGNALTFNVTFGVGYKFKLSDRFNIGFEWSMRKLFIDDFDVTDSTNKILNDPYKMGYSWIKNNDYYTCAFVFLTMDIIKKKSKCNVLKF